MTKTLIKLIITLTIQLTVAIGLFIFICCLLSSCNTSKVVYEIGNKYVPMKKTSSVTGLNYSTIK